ncbi:hypothetical protein V2J09_004808 [Rumex salicifolius]
MAVGGGKGGGGGWCERLKRAARTAFFMVAMIASLLVQYFPLLVAVGDVLVPCILISNFTCIKCYGFREHLSRYSFKSSLVDIPVVSIVRSLIITFVYTICDGPALSHGPYLGSVTICSISSIILLSIKACVFSVHSQLEAEASYTISGRRLHMKKSWGMPVLFLPSVVFALGHMVIAYRTSSRARRKLLFHRVDSDVMLSSKNLLSAFHKVPRSPTPMVKVLRNDSDLKKKLFGSSHGESALPVRLLADGDSLFINCSGYTLHYKLSMPSFPSCSLSSATFGESKSSSNSPTGNARLKHDWTSNVVSKNQRSLHRSCSNQFHGTSLYDPLLESSTTCGLFPNDIPAFSLDDVGEKDIANEFSPSALDLEANGNCGIVLVHGFGGGVFSWRHVMGTLASQVGCPVSAYDRPGWGLTPRILKKDWEEKELPNPYKLETQVDLLLSFCMEMGFSSVILVGHDDGGVLALKAAERVQRSGSSSNVTIKSVVLVGVGLSREVIPSFARILLRTSLGKKHLVRPLLRTEITQVVNRRSWYDATKMTTDVLSLYKAPLYVEGWDDALYEISKLSCETVLSPQAATSLLKAVEQLPVLVIGGAEDELISLRSVQAMASKLRLVAVSGCGHLPHEECPKALLAAMSPFISRLLENEEEDGMFSLLFGVIGVGQVS